MKLRHINHGLLAAIIIINGYIIGAPLLPALQFRADSHGAKRQQLQTKLHKASNHAPSVEAGNRLVVPAMLLDQPVLEGSLAQTYKVLDRGIWRWPQGSTPDKGGNTVLIGHRFTYSNPRGVFYFLNKVKLGDEIGLFWNNNRYIYKVSEVREVLPNDTTIENPTRASQLTLFTCTPLWLPKHRLVVIAQLEAP